MNNNYKDYNIIPIGDHCAISIILKDLGLRNKSYPFDWSSHTDILFNTNIIYTYKNIQTCHNELYDKLQEIICEFNKCENGDEVIRVS